MQFVIIKTGVCLFVRSSLKRPLENRVAQFGRIVPMAGISHLESNFTIDRQYRFFFSFSFHGEFFYIRKRKLVSIFQPDRYHSTQKEMFCFLLQFKNAIPWSSLDIKKIWTPVERRYLRDYGGIFH